MKNYSLFIKNTKISDFATILEAKEAAINAGKHKIKDVQGNIVESFLITTPESNEIKSKALARYNGKSLVEFLKELQVKFYHFVTMTPQMKLGFLDLIKSEKIKIVGYEYKLKDVENLLKDTQQTLLQVKYNPNMPISYGTNGILQEKIVLMVGENSYLGNSNTYSFTIS